jgi:hypothetical protein
MELNITEFFNAAAPMDYSASVAEIGAGAGRATWQAAVEDAPDWPLLDTDKKREAFRNHVRGFGAWDDAEIAEWSARELTALLIQMIAGDIREADLSPDADDVDWAQRPGRPGQLRPGGRRGLLTHHAPRAAKSRSAVG